MWLASPCHQGPLLAVALLLNLFAGSANIAVAYERKISAVTALLPPRGDGPSGAQLRIEAFGGCYQWRSQRPDLVQVEVLQPSEPRVQGEAPWCQPVAVLQSIAHDVEGTEKVLVSAQDVSSPSVVLHCEVYISRIAQIKVETTVRHIYAGDVETLTVTAYDADENVFSSLEGLAFQWKISDESILRPPPVADTEFQLSPARHALALQGMQSDMLLVLGVATGHVSVSATLPGLKHGILQLTHGTLHTPNIDLIVKEHFVIDPDSISVPPMACVRLRLKVIHGRNQPYDLQNEVQVTTPYLHWHSEALEGRSDLLILRPDKGFLIAQRIGSAIVTVKDNRIPNNTASAKVSVVAPVKVLVVPALQGIAPAQSILDNMPHLELDSPMRSLESPWPKNTWFFVEGHTYVLKLSLLDSKSQFLYTPMNFRIDVDIRPHGDGDTARSSSPLRLVRKTDNSVFCTVQAVSVGSGKVVYHDAYVKHEGLPDTGIAARTRWPDLQLEQSFQIFARVSVAQPFPGPLLLPQGHSYTLEVKGGSGGYAFWITNAVPSGVVTVSPDGVVHTSSDIGTAELVVADQRNLANNMSLPILVRRVGALVLKPPQIHLEMPTACSQAANLSSVDPSCHVDVPVLVSTRPELTAGDDPAWRQLRFWTCKSSIMVISGTSSNSFVAEARTSGHEAVSSLGPGICDVISVTPKNPGRFVLSATLERGSADGAQLSVSENFEVYAPLTLKYDVVADSSAAEHRHIMPCTSTALRLHGGPGPMLVPGRVYENMTAATHSTHVRVKPLGDRSFEVVCLRPTPGKVRLLAEVRHEPHDWEAHGSPVVARASVLFSCAVPKNVHIAPLQTGLSAWSDGFGSPREGVQLGLRQGEVHKFSVHYSDSDGFAFDNASVLTPDWSIDSSKIGSWLSVDASQVASITVPSGSDSVGMTLALQAVSMAASTKVCAARHNLDVQDSAALNEALAELFRLLRGTLQLRVTADFLVRWPAHPSQHLPFAPNWVFTWEASHGSGASRLAFNDSVVTCRERHHGDTSEVSEEDCVTQPSSIAEVVHPARICGAGMDCLKALPATPSTAGSTKWFLHPLKPGYVQVAVQDMNHLGFMPEVTEISFLPVGRIVLGLSKVAGDVFKGSVLLMIRGVQHHLNIDVFDSAGHKLDPDHWLPIGLRVNQSDPRLSVEWASEMRTYNVVGTSLGIFDLQVVAYNHPSTPVYSNTLRVNVFEQFGIAPKTAVVSAGQTFEFTLQGGQGAGSAESARVEFSSSKTSVAHVREKDGHLLAIAPGTTRISARLIESETGRELVQVFADVEVVVPDGVSIELIESGNDATSVEQEHPVVLVQDSCDPLRFVASLRGGGLVLTKSLLTAPVGAVEQRAGCDHGCSFKWSSSDPTVTITPVGSAYRCSADALGAAAVDVLAGESLDGKAEETILLTVKVKCPNGYELSDERRLPVMRRLELRSPVLDPHKESTAPLQVPQFGRIPLAFSRNHGHLQVKLLNAGTPALAELADRGASMELLTGAHEGDLQIGVRDSRDGSMVPMLTVTAAVRTPRSVRLVPRMRQLLLHATAECRIMLAGGDGMPMALSTNHVVEHSISHSSVLSSQVVQYSDGGAVLRLSGTKEGCSAVNVTVQVYRASEAGGSPARVSLGEMMLVCVTPGVLVGKSPLLVNRGARVHLSADTAALASPDKQRTALSFSVRLLQAPGGQSSLTQIGSQIAADLWKLMGLPHGSVSVKEVHWAPFDEKSDSIPSGPDVDFEVDLKALKPGVGFVELAELLWFHPELRTVSSPLRFLDLRHGVRAPVGHLAGRVARKSRCSRKLEGRFCGGQEGWVSSAPAVLDLAGPLGDALAKQPGTASARLCFDGISARADFFVSSVGEIQTEVVRGPGTGATPFLVLLRFFTAAGHGVSVNSRELLSGPFLSQDINFYCEPTEAAFQDFFDFDEWSFWNMSSIDSLMPSAAIPRGPGAPQAACSLRPKSGDAKTRTSFKPPSSLRLRVVVSLGELYGAPMETTVELPFVPHFTVVAGAGSQLSNGEKGVVLSLAEPMARVQIWTGGHPVEASLARQLQDSQRGNLALHLSELSSAELTATIVWESSRAFGGSELIDLRLESRATGQVDIVKIQIDGSSSSSTVVESSVQRGGNLRLLLLVLVLALAGWWCVGPMFTHPQPPMLGVPAATAPPPEPPVSVFAPVGMVGGAYTRSSFSQSPFQRVDMRYY